ncbi:putative ATP-dependent RNA helicase DDX49 [Cryptotermes secundus]|uniref:RNA helicase n=1 Tax=Cryptotermes secundus TaxID=105785 RepID=A0A2J7PG42_9NEOP|nr:probable ATP-dependent RNA helicase DDX49 [Cryptotermes secundus]XP_023725120.1 probable ATP-dependent RNA helicase DDX49 [Cryptotermes secundus]XP_023725121.1 probable ATP-dependent RNA helicase DDX49 [Cryptotermes secundus]XP_033611230.1 probable ATP-dependent RNA helicase DDX49 [Cryptotermes secundus]PNF15302.1 putative ATP-dependent RNA helicase DDX49 [Cryptotermes secundus]
MDIMESFSDLKLNSWIVRQCEAMGLKHPTPIQINCIPRILSGEDCIGCAKTGSGKTLAFALPILQKLCEEPYGIFALVLTPTRELAFQIADQFAVIGKAVNLKQCIITGGMDMVQQGQELSKKPHIVIATPGRLADHLESCNTFSLKKIKFLVLDEADRLLAGGGGFDKQLKIIFSALPRIRQNLLFSATITDTLEKVKQVASNKVFMWEAPAEVATVEQLDQFYILCPVNVKDSYLVQTVRMFREKNEKGSIMIFTDTCKNCQLLSMTLNEVGFENVALHAMIRQKERLAALAQFRSNIIRILIATDVASRGLDIPAVELVVNHTLPNLAKDYIHRVGRTARAGRCGMAISLVTPHDIRLLHSIEEAINTKLKEHVVDDKEVMKILMQVSVTRREAEIKLDETNFYEKKLINKRKDLILEGKDPDEVEEEEEKLRIKRRRKKKADKKRQEQS